MKKSKAALEYNKKPRVLFFDIETSPNLGYVWQKYETDVIAFKKEWELLCFAYKWQGQEKVHVVTRQDFRDKTDKVITQTLWSLFDQADVIIAHNGQSFDNKKSKAKFIEHGLPPPSPYKIIDTMLIARSQFNFNSNSLNDLGQLLKLGKKIPTGGFDLWLACMAGDKNAWKKMAKYNKQDVVLLEKVYEKLKPWTTRHPDMAVMVKKYGNCPVCMSPAIQSRGSERTKTGLKPRRQCQDCGHWFYGKTIKEKNK